MYFVTSASIPSKGISCVLDAIPINVSMQADIAAHTESVGENASPFPWLSIGASVMRIEPEARCVCSVRKFPRYRE
jgi:hypothetical protein